MLQDWFVSIRFHLLCFPGTHAVDTDGLDGFQTPMCHALRYRMFYQAKHVLPARPERCGAPFVAWLRGVIKSETGSAIRTDS